MNNICMDSFNVYGTTYLRNTGTVLESSLQLSILSFDISCSW